MKAKKLFVMMLAMTMAAAPLETYAQVETADDTEIMTGNWAPDTRARIQSVIDANAGEGRYVVFDFDNTSIIYDIEEALLIYQIENLKFAIDPVDMPDILATGIPDLALEMDESENGVIVTPEALITDISGDYEYLYNNYEGLEGDLSLDEIHETNEYADFSAKLRYMYDEVGDYFDHAVSYPWVTYLFTGMTPDEVQSLATESDSYWGDYGVYEKVSWTSPEETPGEAGIVTVSYTTGLHATDELLDLYSVMWANDIDVYIVSASAQDVVVATTQVFGYDCPEENVYAMRNQLDENGVYTNEYDYDWGGEGMYAQTQGEGKSTVIENFIAPNYDGAGPLIVFGDSSGDWNMMTDWMECGDTELGVIFNRYRSTSDPIWEGSVIASETIGDEDAQFVLQGRDENTAELRPSEYSILLGTDEEVLVREE